MTRYRLLRTLPKLFLILASVAACGYAARGEAQCYMITFTTGEGAGAGTDSNIFITLRGATKSETIRVSVKVKQDKAGGAFEAGDVDYFVWDGDVGHLEGVVVESDGRYPGSDWKLAAVHVIRLDSAETGQQLLQTIGNRGLRTRGYTQAYDKLKAEGKLVEEVNLQYNDWVTEDEPAVWTRPGLIK